MFSTLLRSDSLGANKRPDRGFGLPVSKTAQMHEDLKGEHPVPRKERLGAKKRKKTNQKKKKKRNEKKRKGRKEGRENKVELFACILQFKSQNKNLRTVTHFTFPGNSKWLRDRRQESF